MKRFLNGKMRMLSLLLSLALAVGLIQANAVTASATTSYTFRYAYERGQDVGVPYLPNLPTPEGPVTEGFRRTMTEAGLL